MTEQEWMEKVAAGQKWCFGCHSWKSLEDFNRDEALETRQRVLQLDGRDAAP